MTIHLTILLCTKSVSISNFTIKEFPARCNKNIDSTDTIVTYFNEKYKLSIKVSDPDNYDYETNNALFTITRLKDNFVVINDSIGTMNPVIEFEDYNKDGVKDILVYHYHGARANSTYYLYVADTKNKYFQKIAGFDDLPNTSIDKNRIITSVALYGRIGYSFYVITKNHKVMQLGKTIETDPADESDAVDKEYKRVLKLFYRH